MHSSNNRITSQLTATAKSASRYFKRSHGASRRVNGGVDLRSNTIFLVRSTFEHSVRPDQFSSIKKRLASNMLIQLACQLHRYV